MNKFLYCKYSNERDKKFSIYTEIREDENKIRYVEKIPIGEEAKGHVDNLLLLYEKLKDLYESENIFINKATKGESGVRFEYLEGKTYEKYVDEVLSEEGKDEALKAIEKYINIVIPENKLNSFKTTHEFNTIFGKVNFPSEMKTLPISDIDLVMSNMIIGDKNTIIDYEWTYLFPIPIDYIKYRIIHYYAATNTKRDELNNKETYEYFGLSEVDIEKYEGMEKSFQEYVQGKNIPLRNLKEDITPGEDLLFGEVDVLSDYERTRKANICFDLGEGYQDSNNLEYTMPNGHLNVKADIPKGTKKIRIKPSEYAGICFIKALLLDNKKIKFSIKNATESEENIFVFPKNCPEIEISIRWHKYSEIYIDLLYEQSDILRDYASKH